MKPSSRSMRAIAQESRSRFHPLDGRFPTLYTSTHPKEPLVALRIQGDAAKAGVWHRETGKLVWAPEIRSSSLCWSPDGSEVYVIGSHGEWPHDRWIFERFTWPARSSIAHCEIQPPEGGVDDVVASPVGDLVLFTWIEQGSAGFEFVDVGKGEPRQVRGAGHAHSPNTQDGPV